MHIPEQDQTRKKFIGWGVGLLAVFTSLRFFKKTPPKQTSNTVKMLTRDGILVEVNRALVQGAKRKIDNEEIHTWINTKTTKK